MLIKVRYNFFYVILETYKQRDEVKEEDCLKLKLSGHTWLMNLKILFPGIVTIAEPIITNKL